MSAMKFEFDPDKSASNRVQHGIDFKEADRLGVPRQAVIKVWIAERLRAQDSLKLKI